MAVSLQSKSAVSSRCAAVRTRSVRVEAVHGAVERAQIAAASMVAAALLVSPAYAGVQMIQPTLKKAFIDDTPAKVKTPSAPKPKAAGSGFSLFGGGSAPATQAAPSAPAPKKVEEPTSDLGLDPRAIALPGAIAFVGGLGLLASKADSEFDDFLARTLIKDNNVGESGVGYEAVIKSTYGGIWGEPTAAGTKKVKAAKKK